MPETQPNPHLSRADICPRDAILGDDTSFDEVRSNEQLKSFLLCMVLRTFAVLLGIQFGIVFHSISILPSYYNSLNMVLP